MKGAKAEEMGYAVNALIQTLGGTTTQLHLHIRGKSGLGARQEWSAATSQEGTLN